MPTWVALSASDSRFGVVVGLVAQNEACPGTASRDPSTSDSWPGRSAHRASQWSKATEEADVRVVGTQAPPAVGHFQGPAARGDRHLAPSTSLRTVKVECAGLVSAARRKRTRRSPQVKLNVSCRESVRSEYSIPERGHDRAPIRLRGHREFPGRAGYCPGATLPASRRPRNRVAEPQEEAVADIAAVSGSLLFAAGTGNARCDCSILLPRLGFDSIEKLVCRATLSVGLRMKNVD